MVLTIEQQKAAIDFAVYCDIPHVKALLERMAKNCLDNTPQDAEELFFLNALLDAFMVKSSFQINSGIV